MKHLMLVLLGVSILVVGILGANQALAADLQDAAGFGTPSDQITSRHLNLSLAAQGRISETETFQTTETLTSVLARYKSQYQLQPGQPKPGQCIVLKQTDSYFVFHQTVLVTLCPAGTGSRALVYREFYLAR